MGDIEDQSHAVGDSCLTSFFKEANESFCECFGRGAGPADDVKVAKY